METLKQYAAKFEAVLESIAQPLKPFLPAIARFLLVVTFLEDSLRISTQWSDQKYYLRKYRGFPTWGADIFLILNVLTMVSCSVLAISKRYTEYAVGGLFVVVVSQSFGYGLIFDSSFLFRTLSVCGGLLMLLADGMLTNRRSKNLLFAGLPTLSETDRTVYIQLFGRILLVFLFLSFIFAGELTLVRLIVAIISFAGCVMVVIGFKAKWSAWMLITFLSISNVVLNNWWSLHHTHPQRDFQKYDFFQNLSIMGGFLLLVNMGPGGLSIDEKKKSF
ncbi:SURF4 family-domain-containing protein [Zopfochytrium polystomum]|nr:SURF4 family-domain-containing protein [Zopfochytrium polystomum]